jgi:hypothetical protein
LPSDILTPLATTDLIKVTISLSKEEADWSLNALSLVKKKGFLPMATAIWHQKAPANGQPASS